MATIDIAESPLEAQLRFIDVLAEHLPGELDDAETPDFPLPEPEVYLEEPEETHASVFRATNADEVVVLVTPFRPTEKVAERTSSSMEYEQQQDLQMLVQVNLRPTAGFEAPTVRSGKPTERTLTEREWMRRRGEKYKGAMIHTITKHVTDGRAVDDVTIDSHDAETVPSQDFGHLAVGSVLVGAVQNVLVPMTR